MAEIYNLNALCRCCHADGKFRDISFPCCIEGSIEMCGDILRDTFGISMHIPSAGASSTICDTCVQELKAAAVFKRRVLECEKKLKEYLKHELSQQINIKLEKEECDFDGNEVKPGIFMQKADKLLLQMDIKLEKEECNSDVDEDKQEILHDDKSNRHKQELDPLSEEIKSFEIPIISESDSLNYNRIRYSNQSDVSIDPSTSGGSTSRDMANSYEKQSAANQESHNSDESGLSFLNISSLTENAPINFQQYLFQDGEAQGNDQISAAENFLEVEFSHSDGSDDDTKEADYNSDDSEKVTDEEEYYDDSNVKRQKNNRKRKSVNKNKEGNEKGVTSQKRKKDPTKVVKNRPGKRIWNRKNACVYCQEVVTNFSRHILRKHANEIEVLMYKSINDADPKIRKQKRQAITDKLRNKGNFMHNSKVSFDLSSDDGESLLPRKRNHHVTSNPSSYVTCKACLGTFKRLSFFRHFKMCKAKSNENELESIKKKVLYNHSITITPNVVHASVEFTENILAHLRPDDISLVVRNDELIIAYGSQLLKNKKKKHCRKVICSKMRDLANMLTILRRKDDTIETLSDALQPEKYDKIIDSIKEMCGYDEDTGRANITSIPIRMRPSLLGCIDILYTESIMSTESPVGREVYKNKLDDFKRLIESNWQWEPVDVNKEIKIEKPL